MSWQWAMLMHMHVSAIPSQSAAHFIGQLRFSNEGQTIPSTAMHQHATACEDVIRLQVTEACL